MQETSTPEVTRTRQVAGHRHPRILVAGLGNPLMGDDGVGVHACRAWAAQRPRPVHLLVAEVGTAIYDALHLLEWADCVLVIDAMQAGGAPGSLYLADPHELELKPASVSLHDLTLLGALPLLRTQRPRRIRVLGIEPCSMQPGTELSVPVAAAIPVLLGWAKDVVAAWSAPSASVAPSLR